MDGKDGRGHATSCLMSPHLLLFLYLLIRQNRVGAGGGEGSRDAPCASAVHNSQLSSDECESQQTTSLHPLTERGLSLNNDCSSSSYCLIFCHLTESKGFFFLHVLQFYSFDCFRGFRSI